VAAGAALQVIGDPSTRAFPRPLRRYIEQRSKGHIKVNLSVQCAYADIDVIETLWPGMRLDEIWRSAALGG
jgi:hypothetical protein